MYTVQLCTAVKWCYTQYSVYVLLFLLDPNYSWELKSPTSCDLSRSLVFASRILQPAVRDLYRSRLARSRFCSLLVLRLGWCAEAAQWSLRCAHRPA